MSIYAIGDLHLSFQTNKPMDVFGWTDYEDKLKNNWLNTVDKEDTVILPGDFSWAMYLNEAVEDFKYINSLPGRKILLKGNHDYWWETITKMNKFLAEHGYSDIYFLHNNSYEAEGLNICGTKGWDGEETDKKIINRETERFKISLSSIKNDNEKLAVFHYPPYYCRELMDLMKEYEIKKCIYGHIHGARNVQRYHDDTECILVSSDYLDFRLLRI